MKQAGIGLIAHSAMNRAPALKAPAGACDSHLHIQDARFAASAPILSRATVKDYHAVQALLGTERTVIVQSRPYGTDNQVVLDAISQLGIDRARGIAVIHPDLSTQDLDALHAGGIRGIRFSLFRPEHAAVEFSMLAPLATRIAALGWHVQLHWTAEQIVSHESLLKSLACPMVFDHFARIPSLNFRAHPAFDIVSSLLAQGRAWVKLSGAYLATGHADDSSYADLLPLARALIACAPTRMLWGSDWPHTTEAEPKPDDASLFELLGHWAESDERLHQILVTNPAELYGFTDSVSTGP